MQVSDVFELVVYAVIFLGGIICNTLVIRGFYLMRSRRAGDKTLALNNGKNDFINQLIINLAIADLLTLLIGLPTDVVPDYVSWPFGTFICKYISTAQDITIPVSTLTFAAIAAERYAVSRGTPGRCAKCGKVLLFGIWMTPCLTIYVPFALYKKIIQDEGREECNIEWPNIYIARFFLFYVFVLVLSCAITGAIAYCGIRRNLKRIQRLYLRSRSNAAHDEANNAKQDDSFAEQSMKISNMLFLLIALFIVCTAPYLIFAVLLELGFMTNTERIYYTYIGTSCLLYCNCLANPLTVLITNRECRHALNSKRPAQIRQAGSRAIVLV